jgi:hypothetical protein
MQNLFSKIKKKIKAETNRPNIHKAWICENDKKDREVSLRTNIHEPIRFLMAKA